MSGSRWPSKSGRWRGDACDLDPCAYCGNPSETWDHIEPQSRGSSTADNFAASCARCNLAKASLSILTFLARRALFERVRRIKPKSAVQIKECHRLSKYARPKVAL